VAEQQLETWEETRYGLFWQHVQAQPEWQAAKGQAHDPDTRLLSATRMRLIASEFGLVGVPHEVGGGGSCLLPAEDGAGPTQSSEKMQTPPDKTQEQDITTPPSAGTHYDYSPPTDQDYWEGQ